MHAGPENAGLENDGLEFDGPEHVMDPQYIQMHCEPTSTVTSRRLRSD